MNSGLVSTMSAMSTKVVVMVGGVLLLLHLQEGATTTRSPTSLLTRCRRKVATAGREEGEVTTTRCRGEPELCSNRLLGEEERKEEHLKEKVKKNQIIFLEKLKD